MRLSSRKGAISAKVEQQLMTHSLAKRKPFSIGARGETLSLMVYVPGTMDHRNSSLRSGGEQKQSTPLPLIMVRPEPILESTKETCRQLKRNIKRLFYMNT